MEIKKREIVEEKTFLSYMILDCLNNEANNTIDPKSDYIEIEFKCNGVELDFRKFTKHLEDSWDYTVNNAATDQAEERFEQMKHKFVSKNSSNAKLAKVKDQLDKLQVQFNNMINHVKDIKSIEDNID